MQNVGKLNVPRLVVGGATSGVGKTSITCSIIHALRKRGYSVQPFKVGPDYIDPSYLSAAAGNTARNLDSWIMGDKAVMRSFVKNSTSDISIIEGVMGYYDGFSGASNFSSTHHVASILQTPSILVLDASRTARSIAATALGYTKFHRNSRIAGFILNKIGSKKHEMMCREALATLKIPILGCIPKNQSLSLESRHLGLIPATEQTEIRQKISKMSREISKFIDVDSIALIASKAPMLAYQKETKDKKPQITIAVALDKSFNFYYYDNFDALKRHGAKIEFFSPISDARPPPCSGLYIGGGFPEVLGQPLAKNQMMKKAIRELAEDSMPIYGECGGLMYLTKSIDYEKKKFQMVGLFDAQTSMEKKMVLNYTSGTAISDCVVATKSSQFFGHEFHYSELKSIPKDAKFAYKMTIGTGIKNKKDGLIEYNTLASYMHLYFARSRHASNFVKHCIKYSRR
ncbi:Cobyrinate a,c-diamide synthase [Candidatus Nitrosotenuis uzonensis]|uniref:Cobyrinate a,c-diamide synthase n=1 Tax=Candidatus Nitrosotenuis uzonensis TaxID=1407055 RepID=A0A812F047_9ARCH|nr:Cobyrinate a,c-diamide synthase [Candidatus Nitrosotenuis uzonensis]